MSLGTGIVTATVLIVFVVSLYLISKHKKWKLVAKVVGGFVAFVLALSAATWAYLQIQHRPKVVYELAGVSLGMSPADVKIMLGAATNEFTTEQSGADVGGDLIWTYQESYRDDYSTFLRFEKQESGQPKLAIICDNRHPELFGLSTYSKVAELEKKLGKPSSESISKNGLQKSMSFEEWQTSFIIEQGRISEICISSSGAVEFIVSD